MAEPDQEESLILAVQEFPAIYEEVNPQYNERWPGGVVQNIWREIFDKLVAMGYGDKIHGWFVVHEWRRIIINDQWCCLTMYYY